MNIITILHPLNFNVFLVGYFLQRILTQLLLKLMKKLGFEGIHTIMKLTIDLIEIQR